MKWLNWPNRLTIARIVMVVPMVICLLNLNEWPHARHITLGLFIATAMTDALDGYLARRLREETPIGRFLDPLADKLLVTSSVIILAMDHTSVRGAQLPNWVPVLAIGKDLAVVIGFLLIHLTTNQFFIRPRPLGKACTMVQLMMVGVVLLSPDLPNAFRFAPPLLWWTASILAILAASDYVIVGNRFAKRTMATQKETST